MLSSKQVLLKLLQVIQEQHDGEEKEPTKVVAAATAPSTPAASFAKTERREPTASIIQFRCLSFTYITGVKLVSSSRLPAMMMQCENCKNKQHLWDQIAWQSQLKSCAEHSGFEQLCILHSAENRVVN
jgi:hypothetical protein